MELKIYLYCIHSFTDIWNLIFFKLKDLSQGNLYKLWEKLVKFLSFSTIHVILYTFHFIFIKILEYVFLKLQSVLFSWKRVRWHWVEIKICCGFSEVCKVFRKHCKSVFFRVSKVVYFTLSYLCFFNYSYSL